MSKPASKAAAIAAIKQAAGMPSVPTINGKPVTYVKPSKGK